MEKKNLAFYGLIVDDVPTPWQGAGERREVDPSGVAVVWPKEMGNNDI